MSISDWLVEGFQHSADAWSPRIHDHSNGESVLLSELLQGARANAISLNEALASRPNRLVAVIMPNGIGWLSAAMSIFTAEATLVPLPLPSGFAGGHAYLEHITGVLESGDIQTVLYDGSAQTATLKRLVAQLPAIQFLDVRALPAPQADPPPLPRPVATAASVLQYTSGSTSRPKGVVLTQQNVVAALDILRDQFFLSPTDVFGSWLPLFHDMGLFMTLAALRSGSSVRIWTASQAAKRPLAWLRSFAEHRCTVFAAPNFFYEQVADEAEQSSEPLEMDLTSCRIAINGAETVRASTIRRFCATFAGNGFTRSRLWPSYGLAEATLPAALQRPGEPFSILSVSRTSLALGSRIELREDGDVREIVGCGRALRATELRIVDSEHQPLPEDTVGEIQLRGPSVTPGYLNADEQIIDADGWLSTGDLGFLHQGELFLTGRRKNMAAIGGRNVYAEDLEDLIRREIGGKTRCGVEAGIDANGAEYILAVFESDATPEDRAELEQAVRKALAGVAGPDALTVRAVLPRQVPHTSSGKVQRGRLSELPTPA